MSAERLSHVDDEGAVSMVDVSAKPEVERQALAEGFIRLSEATRRLIAENGLKKGDVMATAKIAGIQAAKQTAALIPLCHTLPLSHVGIDLALTDEGCRITASARTNARTGVEMEALTAVSIAALTIYDMCKAVDKQMEISGVRLLHKEKASRGH